MSWQYPHRFDSWPEDDRRSWVEMSHGRVEILREIGRLAEIEELQQRELSAGRSRMRKSEIARLVLALRDKDRAIEKLQRERDDLERRYEQIRDDL